MTKKIKEEEVKELEEVIVVEEPTEVEEPRVEVGEEKPSESPLKASVEVPEGTVIVDEVKQI